MTENGESLAPDSWDQDDAQETSDVASQLSNLNVNAPAFVPGQNVYAAEFVPSFQKSVPAAVPPAEETPNSDEPPPQEEKSQTAETEMEELEKWEDEAVQDNEMELDEEEETAPVNVSDDSGSKKEHVNVVFIGHVDAGKSTIGGHIMYLTGMVDKRTLEKYEREAKEKNRETWYLSWALDTNLEEREKGKTVEVGRAFFETENRHFTILDAPGHKSFVPNMIGGASQADLAVLVISARKGEFETGFERGGQTREHAMLVKTAGVKHLIVVINKMDDPTVLWSEERYTECKEKLLPYLKKCGFNPKTEIFFIPVSGLNGAFLKDIPEESMCPWYRGPSLITYLDTMPSFNRSMDLPVRMPIVDRYKDMGIMLLGKLESGCILRNQTFVLMPNRATVKIMQIFSDEIEVETANPGENLKLKVTGVEEEDVSPGFVLCPSNSVCHTARTFDAQIVILEHKSIICAGYSAILHIHACAEEVTIKTLLCIIDRKSGEKVQLKPRFVKQDQAAIARIEVHGGMICLETFKDFPQMGRFTLRDEGKTIAIGKVLKIRD
ncbi:eukaryotic peptide chain release factor GTP-binding subunit ERF3A-like isoform X2 [Ostrea edulis]|uniref:eukaryotic peptide chain release factor GTP-binding subunit ERF3A-like isoform X2 n=1 Tax=Ostrea edulis TaxID=37623 RepID=UPI002095A082|nr:eukaryotic peptide chain release factor GTP-binding subunit ERF3A-like isoform X2 [Ostrea edulis]